MKKTVLFLAVLLCLAPPPVLADFLAGRRAYDRQDWRAAIAELRPLAEQGDARAQVILGNMYANGYGVAQDGQEAFGLYYAAANKGNAEAMLMVAIHYYDAQDFNMALTWSQRAAMRGDQAAAFFYATRLYEGNKSPVQDVKPDHPQSYKWFRIAAKLDRDPQLKKMAGALADTLAREIGAEAVKKMDAEANAFKPVSD